MHASRPAAASKPNFNSCGPSIDQSKLDTCSCKPKNPIHHSAHVVAVKYDEKVTDYAARVFAEQFCE